jgi:uncharacterized lipoprotein YmbA
MMSRAAVSAAGLPCRLLVKAAVCGAALWLGACAAPQATRFHTLMAAPPAAAALERTPPPAGPDWELLPVGIPAQVDRPQLVVQRADGTLAVVEQERWIAPLADELQAAIAERLTHALGVQEVPGRSHRERWRVRIEVRRLDSALGRSARLEADWRLRSSEDPKRVLRCHARYEQTVGPGYAALAAGHRAAVAGLAEGVASALRALEAGESPPCPPGAGA